MLTYAYVCLRYLGTLAQCGARGTPQRVWDDEEVYAKMYHIGTRNRAVRAHVRIPDDTARSYVAIGFSAVNRWGVHQVRSLLAFTSTKVQILTQNIVRQYVRDVWHEFPGGERALDLRMREHGDMFVGPHFTCFTTSTKVQILTKIGAARCLAPLAAVLVLSLLASQESTNTDAKFRSTLPGAARRRTQRQAARAYLLTTTKIRILTQNAAARCLALLADVLNNRLYERVREKGGLGAHVTCFTNTQVVGLLS
jgi:hypothetical protein